jgi:MoaA/NifB/PqqE/SkfB family radical SAM enzyme
LHFAGGEPLLIPQMFEFLEYLIRQDRARKIKVSYNTNLTVLPDRLGELWSHFRSVRVTTSLDGYDEVNSYIRYPAQWAVIDRNLQLLDDGQKFNCNGGLGVNVTVQAYNIFRLPELVEYLALRFQNVEAPNMSLLRAPEYLSVQILPPSLKEAAASRLERFSQEFDDRCPVRWQGEPLKRLKASLAGIARYMMAADRRDLLPEFRKWTRHLDENRKEQMEDVLPELAPLYEIQAAQTAS